MQQSNVAAITLVIVGILGLGLATASTADAANVTVARSGRGSVTGSIVTGTVINCPSDCSEFVVAGNITLTANPAAGWTFGRWDGRCTGSPSRSCTFAVPVFEDVAVTATFNGAPATFNVDTTLDAVDTDPGDGACKTATGACSLRAATQEANALVRSLNAHRINLPSGTFPLTIAPSGANGSTTGDFNIENETAIVGAGAGATIIDGNGLDRVLNVAAGATFATISDLTIRNGVALGGGVRNSSSFLTVRNVTVSGNSGGGIHNFGLLNLFDSTVTGNGSELDGGGILNQGGVVLVNVTLSGNRSNGGGGLSNRNGAQLFNVTVSGNTTSGADGGGILNSGSLTAVNVLVGGNVAGSRASNCGGQAAIVSRGHNLSSDASCAAGFTAAGDRNNTDPRLAPLQPNGGPTLTHALLPGSPAINGGDNANCPTSDQRGIPRPIGGTCDIGAVEYQGSREEFVTRFYAGVLGRSPEPDGLAAWTAALRASCSPQSFAALSGSFFDSLEFRTERPQSVEGLVALLYRTFLGRDPDPAGLAGWAQILRQVRLAVALEGFVPSPEFQNLLPDRTNRAAVAALVTRLYRQLLAREPDPAGLQSFVDFIVTTGNLEGAATGFLASPEFESRPQTARDYVFTLYATFLDRRPDPAGLEAWEGILRQTLLAIINAGFVPSPEFQGLVPQVCG